MHHDHVETTWGEAVTALAVPDQLAEADAIIFGTPTRFGNMCAQSPRSRASSRVKQRPEILSRGAIAPQRKAWSGPLARRCRNFGLR